MSSLLIFYAKSFRQFIINRKSYQVAEQPNGENRQNYQGSDEKVGDFFGDCSEKRFEMLKAFDYNSRATILMRYSRII